MHFPCLQSGNHVGNYVSKFKYLGHIINNGLTDDDDIGREIRSMFARTNILMRRFGKCSLSVKLQLFKSYCLCMYDTALWVCYLKGTMDRLRSCYNKCIKLFFGYDRYYSLTQTLFELGLPSFDTIMSNSKFRFSCCLHSCSNMLVEHVTKIGA